MVNEGIVTALKNSIDRGDSLESAKQIMINSGYNPQEVFRKESPDTRAYVLCSLVS